MEHAHNVYAPRDPCATLAKPFYSGKGPATRASRKATMLVDRKTIGREVHFGCFCRKERLSAVPVDGM